MSAQRYRLVLLFAAYTVVGGCNVVAPSRHRTEDYTPVFAAASGGDLATVQAGLAKDPALVKTREWDGATLLHDAVQQNHEDIAKYLLDEGADVNATTKDGLTPLHMAAQNGNVAIITLLIERGAKVDAVDEKRWTPLDRAERWGHSSAAQFLRQRGARQDMPRP